MQLVSGLSAELDILTATADDPAVDLARSTRDFVADLGGVAASITTVIVTVEIGGGDLRFTAAATRETGESAATSLRVLFVRAPQSATTAHVLLRSDAAHSLTSLAADAVSIFGDDAVEIDRHLDVGPLIGSGPDLASIRETDRAVGVLVDGGRTPAEGRAEIRRLAALWGASQTDVARRVLRDAVRWHPPRGDGNVVT